MSESSLIPVVIRHTDTTVDTMIVSQTKHRLVGYGDFATLADSIKMRLFGHMVALAAPVVKEYHGDLLIDAEWVRSLEGEVSTLYTVRHSGTNLGMLSAPLSLALNPTNATMYGLSLIDEGGQWYLLIDQHMLVVGG